MNWIEKKSFYIFILINMILWVAVESLRNIISRDSMEAIVWGNLVSFGTNKHPPLSGWLAGGAFHLFQEHNIAIYLLGAVCISVSLIYTYKLAKFFLDEKKAICSSLILTTGFYYTFQLFYDNFNCNIISMPLWSMMTYYFYKSVNSNKLKDWLLVGLLAGLSFMAKYQVVLLFFAMFLYLLICERKCFKQKNMYLALFIAFLTVLPHLLWMQNNDWFSMEYLAERTKPIVYNSLILNILHRVIVSLKFFADQLLALLPCFVLYAILAIKEKSFSFNPHSEDNKNQIFLLLIGLLPLLMIGSSGLITSNRVVGAWGVTMTGNIGILLFYFFPIKISDDSYKLFAKFIVAIMLIWQLAMAVFACLQTKIDMGYPYKEVINDFNSIWANYNDNQTLKYVAGDINYIFQFELYNPNKTKVLLDTYGHKNVWVAPQEVVKSGVLVVAKNEDALQQNVDNLSAIFPIKKEAFVKGEYTYKIIKKIKKSKEDTLYYLIIKPQNNE